MVYINESIAYYTRIQLNNLNPLRRLSSLISSPTYCYVYSESVFWVAFFLKSFFTVMMSFKSLLAELYIGLIMPRMYSWDAEAISELFPLSPVFAPPSFLQSAVKVVFLDCTCGSCHSPVSHLFFRIPHWWELWFPNCVCQGAPGTAVNSCGHHGIF